MPTGYTAELMEKGMPFEKFVMQCARAFGALIEMRDEPLDAPIPHEVAQSTYHAKALVVAREKLKGLEAMTPDECAAAGKQLRDDAIRSTASYEADARAEDARLAEMRAQVEAWTPPTGDHVELKKFMLDQIKISENGDFAQDRLREVTEQTEEGYFEEALTRARSSITYHTEEAAKEQERNAKRNEWVKVLRAALKPARGGERGQP